MNTELEKNMEEFTEWVKKNERRSRKLHWLVRWFRRITNRCEICGSNKDPWFSRTEPMGYYCEDCDEKR